MDAVLAQGTHDEPLLVGELLGDDTLVIGLGAFLFSPVTYHFPHLLVLEKDFCVDSLRFVDNIEKEEVRSSELPADWFPNGSHNNYGLDLIFYGLDRDGCPVDVGSENEAGICDVGICF